MKNVLDWHTSDDEPAELRADSTALHDDGTPLPYVLHDGTISTDWTACFEGHELRSGTLSECMFACEEDNSMTAAQAAKEE